MLGVHRQATGRCPVLCLRAAPGLCKHHRHCRHQQASDCRGKRYCHFPDLTFNAGRETSIEEVNQILKEAAEGDLSEVLSYCDKPLVSSDYNHIPYSSNFDALQTRVNGSLVKVMAWYDNEWGFSNRMLDNSLALLEADS